ALSLLLVSSSRWRPWLAVAAGCMTATFATGVLFAGWHRPSDALGALAWSGFLYERGSCLGNPAARPTNPFVYFAESHRFQSCHIRDSPRGPGRNLVDRRNGASRIFVGCPSIF